MERNREGIDNLGRVEEVGEAPEPDVGYARSACEGQVDRRVHRHEPVSEGHVAGGNRPAVRKHGLDQLAGDDQAIPGGLAGTGKTGRRPNVGVPAVQRIVQEVVDRAGSNVVVADR